MKQENMYVGRRVILAVNDISKGIVAGTEGIIIENKPERSFIRLAWDTPERPIKGWEPEILVTRASSSGPPIPFMTLCRKDDAVAGMLLDIDAGDDHL